MTQSGWTKYEWDVEECTSHETPEHEEGEVIEHHFCESFSECMKVASRAPLDGFKYEIVLVLDTYDCRSWAYFDEDTMKLSEYFEDASGSFTRKVPVRFRAEIEKFLKMS